MPRLVIVLMLLACGVSFGTVLSDLAAALPAHTWVKLPSNASLNAISLNHNYLGYVDSGIWDPFHRQAAIVAASGTCCITDPDRDSYFRRMQYDERTDTWTIAATPYATQGHGYDANACNPATGEQYFAVWDSRILHKWDGSNWSDLPNFSLSWTTYCVGLSWFPELFSGQGGLVYVGGGGAVGLFNGTNWTARYAPTGWSTIDVFSEYNPVHKVVWMGGGDYGTDVQARITYKLDAQGALTRMNDAPFGLSSSGSVLKSCDPVSGKYLVFVRNTNTWWEYDIAADAWSEVTNMVNKPADLIRVFQAPIPEYGVIMVFNQDTKEVYLYRHTAGTSVARDGRPSSVDGMALEVAPNPVKNSARISLSAGGAGEYALMLYGSNGKLVRQWKPGAGLRTGVACETSSLPAGVYLLKAVLDGNRYSRRLVVLR